MRDFLIVIDDEICPQLIEQLCGKKIKVWKIENGVCIPDEPLLDGPSHGTICASLAGEFLPEMELAGIATGSRGNAQMKNVCSALEWCHRAGASVVCMSMGVMAGLSLERMGAAVRDLKRAGCSIFCACSNDGKLTFPAAFPWTVGVAYDPAVQGAAQVDPRWGHDVAVGPFSSCVLDDLARENDFFHGRTNSLAVAYAASQVLRAGGVKGLPQWRKELRVSDVNSAFRQWEKPVVRLQHSQGRWGPLLWQLTQKSYWPALLTGQGTTDWSKMTARVEDLEEAAALLPLLEETSLLFLDLPENGPRVWDLELDLALCSAEEAFRQLLVFFGEEAEP